MKDSDWEILAALYKNPNITKVANTLFMTQPSLSKRLQHMEEEFGTQIVERLPKGLLLTPEGEYLGKQADRYLAFLRETKNHLESMKNGDGGSINIGSSYTFSKFRMSEILVKYRGTHPEIRFHVVNAKSDALFKMTLEGSLDAAFIRGDYEGNLNKRYVETSYAYLVTKDKVELEELLRMQYLGYSTNAQTLSELNKWWRDWFSMDCPEGMTVGHVDVTWDLIQQGLGYTCCFLPDDFENQYQLHLSPLHLKDGTAVKRNTWFIYSKNKRQPAALREFIAYVEEELN